MFDKTRQVLRKPSATSNYGRPIVRRHRLWGLWAGCLLLICGISCNPDEEEFLFEVPFQGIITIEAGLSPLFGHPYYLMDIQNLVLDNLQQRGINPEEVKSIDPGVATLTVVGSNANFSFLREISVRLFTDSPGPEGEIFYRDDENLWNEDQIVDLIPSLVNVREEGLEESFSIEVVIFPRVINTQIIEARLDFSLRVR